MAQGPCCTPWRRCACDYPLPGSRCQPGDLGCILARAPPSRRGRWHGGPGSDRAGVYELLPRARAACSRHRPRQSHVRHAAPRRHASHALRPPRRSLRDGLLPRRALRAFHRVGHAAAGVTAPCGAGRLLRVKIGRSPPLPFLPTAPLPPEPDVERLPPASCR